MLAKVYSCAVVGLDGALVEVEVDTANGLPSIVDVGSYSQYRGPLFGKTGKERRTAKVGLMSSIYQFSQLPMYPAGASTRRRPLRLYPHHITHCLGWLTHRDEFQAEAALNPLPCGAFPAQLLKQFQKS